MKSYLGLIIAILLPFYPTPIFAEWLGLMQNSTAGSEIDSPNLDSKDIALAFDGHNNGICTITQKSTSYYRLLHTRHAAGSNYWSPSSVLNPIDNLTIVGDAQEPSVNLLPDGYGMCVFSQFSNLSARHRIYGDVFSANFTIVNGSAPIDNGTIYNAVQPSVAMLPNRAGIIAYVQGNSGQNRIYASKWENNQWTCWGSTGWATTGSMVPIDGPEVVNVSQPRLALSSTGDIHAVFVKEGTGIYAARYQTGQWAYWGVAVGGWIPAGQAGLSAPISLSGSGYDADQPSLAALPDGRMICVYQRKNKTDGNSRLYASLYNGSSWSADTALVDADANTVSAARPDVAANYLGMVVCVYAKGNTQNVLQHVYASQWSGSSWDPMNAGNPLDTLGNSVTAITPKIAFDQSGNAISVFQVWKTADSQCRVMANYFQGPPSVSSVSPDGATNDGVLLLTVNGFNFAGGSTPDTKVKAWLRKTGQAGLSGSNIIVPTPTFNFYTATQFTVEFDLTNAAVGDWDLVLQNPDGQQCVFPRALGVTWPNLNQAYVFPNPIRVGGTGAQGASHLRFYNLMHTTSIRIYSLDGRLVKTLEKDDRQLFIDWDLNTNQGALVAPGVYFYRMESPGGTRKGKFMVIR